jgi:hypothetical protein
MTQVQIKSPGSIFDLSFDWDADSVLSASETISTSSWAVSPTGEMTTSSPAIDNDTKQTSVMVTAGNDRTTYRLTNTIATSAGRTHERMITVRVAPVGL